MLQFYTNLLVTITTKIPTNEQKSSMSDKFKQKTIDKNYVLVKTIPVEIS